jgi:hypothetical protein
MCGNAVLYVADTDIEVEKLRGGGGIVFLFK